MASEVKTWVIFSASKLADALSFQAEIDHCRRPAGKIDDHTRQGFVERGVGVGEAGDAGTIAECLIEVLAQGPARNPRRCGDRRSPDRPCSAGADRSGHAWSG